MKKKSILILTLVLTICLSMLLSSCEKNTCEHSFDNACDGQCNSCEYERTSFHVWKEVSCFNPKTCRNCGLEEGEALVHTYDPNCEIESICDHCSMRAMATDHKPDENGVCTICGESVLVTTELE